MAGRAKKNAQRERRKMEKRATKARVQAEYQAKIEAGKNSRTRADRIAKKSLRNKLVKNEKQLSSAPRAYVPPSRYHELFAAV